MADADDPTEHEQELMALSLQRLIALLLHPHPVFRDAELRRLPEAVREAYEYRTTAVQLLRDLPPTLESNRPTPEAWATLVRIGVELGISCGIVQEYDRRAVGNAKRTQGTRNRPDVKARADALVEAAARKPEASASEKKEIADLLSISLQSASKKVQVARRKLNQGGRTQ